jgi:hypothetical protein
LVRALAILPLASSAQFRYPIRLARGLGPRTRYCRQQILAVGSTINVRGHPSVSLPVSASTAHDTGTCTYPIPHRTEYLPKRFSSTLVRDQTTHLPITEHHASIHARNLAIFMARLRVRGVVPSRSRAGRPVGEQRWQIFEENGTESRKKYWNGYPAQTNKFVEANH